MEQPVNSAAEPKQRQGPDVTDTPAENFRAPNLWIGNVSPKVSESELKALFESHGEVLDVCLYPSRCFAFMYFKETVSAISAMNGLQGHLLRGKPLKIEFAQPARPRNSLWVAKIGQSVSKEELEKEFLKFGKIKEMRFLRDGKTARIDYARLEDATWALKRMNGKRIGDDQIRVDFLRPQSLKREQGMDVKEGQSRGNILAPSEFQWMAEDSLKNYPQSTLSGTKKQNVITNSKESRTVAARSNEFGHGKDSIAYYSGPKSEFRELPFRPVQMYRKRPIFPGCPPPRGLPGPDVYRRPPPLSSFFTFRPDRPGPEKSSYQAQIGGPNWKWPSPTPGIGSSPSADFSLSNRYVSGPWNASDSSQIRRESKRSRFDPAALLSDRIENQGGSDENYGLNSLSSGRLFASLTGATAGGFRPLHVEGDCIWRGVIAKGGNPVCRARCIRIGEGIDAHIPEVINCSARTGLDMLSKHYDSAVGFNIVYFFPDSEHDFCSYTEFLKLLVSKARAMVAKFDDGTTLFLVPPSDFLTKVLNTSGPECLCGIVLKIPQVASNSTSMNLQSIHNSDNSYRRMPLKMEQSYQNEHLQTSQDWEIRERIRTDAEKNEQYKAIMSLAVSLLSQVRRQHDIHPG